MPILYTSDGSSYEGMDEVTVTRIRADLGKSSVFVDQASHAAAIEATKLQHVPFDQSKERLDWLTEKTKGNEAAIQFLAKRFGLE